MQKMNSIKKSPLTEFCDKKGISANIKNAFGAYLRTEYADRFLLGKDGETIHLMIGRLSQEQLEEAWMEFVKAMARYLTK